jgi:hypothetical protein
MAPQPLRLALAIWVWQGGSDGAGWMSPTQSRRSRPRSPETRSSEVSRWMIRDRQGRCGRHRCALWVGRETRHQGRLRRHSALHRWMDRRVAGFRSGERGPPSVISLTIAHDADSQASSETAAPPAIAPCAERRLCNQLRNHQVGASRAPRRSGADERLTLPRSWLGACCYKR